MHARACTILPRLQKGKYCYTLMRSSTLYAKYGDYMAIRNNLADMGIIACCGLGIICQKRGRAARSTYQGHRVRICGILRFRIEQS